MIKAIRIGSANTGSDVLREMNIDFRLESPSQVLDQVDKSIGIMEEIVHKGGEAECDVVVFPEAAMCLSGWESANWGSLEDVLPEAVNRMLQRLGEAAASYSMYLICCNDVLESNGTVRNAAFFLGRDGREIGRYHKVNLPVQEHLKKPGDNFPVFETPDLGGVGMLICYDMVFPEAARCLALGGANIIFCPTQGGASFGRRETSCAAFLTRAVENFTYIVVSWGGWGTDIGSMIISPLGEILAEEKTAGALAIADIDPFGGREVGDWSNSQADMRARLFRERRPEAYKMLTDPHPPVLSKLPHITPAPPKEISEIYHRASTVGHGHYREAEEYLRNGQIEKAIKAFESLREQYPGTWFDRISRERLAEIQKS